MANLIGPNEDTGVDLAQNYRRTTETTSLGTRKISFYTVVDYTQSLVDGWDQPGSNYFRAVRRLQQTNSELFYLGKPRNTNDGFFNNWSGYSPVDADCFVFAIPDQDSNGLFSDNWYTNFTATIIGDYDTNYITLDSDYSDELYVGMQIKFTSSNTDQLVVGKIYYISAIESDGDYSYIKLSETVDSHNNNGNPDYPTGVKGYPGAEIEFTNETISAEGIANHAFIGWPESYGGDVVIPCNVGTVNPEYDAIVAINFMERLWDEFDLGPVDIAVFRCQQTDGVYATTFTAP